MLLLLDEEHKAHLALLSQAPAEGLTDLLGATLDLIDAGTSGEPVSSLAEKVGSSADVVEKCLDGLLYLLTEASQLMISEIDFHDSIMTLGLGEEHRNRLVAAYLENRARIRQLLQQLGLQPTQYHDLEWRLNVKLASRSLRGQMTPNVLMKLHTRQGERRATELLQCDLPNLVNLTNSLEEALSEAKSQYTRRILRNIK